LFLSLKNNSESLLVHIAVMSLCGAILADIVANMKVLITVVNVTLMGAFRSDAHVGTWSRGSRKVLDRCIDKSGPFQLNWTNKNLPWGT
jgi:hypothetical protein